MRTVLKNVIALQFPRKSLGRPCCDLDEVFSSIDLVLRSGMAWRHLSATKHNIHYSTVHKLFRKWTKAGVFEETYRRLLVLRNRRPRRYCVDSTYVKNQYGRDMIGKNPTDRGRNATKLSVLVDGQIFSLIETPHTNNEQCTLKTMPRKKEKFQDG